jgi:hypothetical protein
MSRPYPTGFQTFQKDWTQTASWAQANGITSQEYMPVYQQDVSHYQQYGYGMSQGSRIQAIKAAAGYSAPTAIPSDSPDPWHIFSNSVSDLQNIFTGLMPWNIVPDIFDTIKGVLEHPTATFSQAGEMLAAIGTSQESELMKQYVLSPNSAWAWVPGMADLAYASQGKSGIDHLLTHPITSVLDALPMGKTIPAALARTDAGAALAGSIGLAPEEMSKLNVNQLAWRSFMHRPTKLVGPRLAPDGSLKIVPLTHSDLLRRAANHIGIGSQQGTIMRGLTIADQQVIEQTLNVALPAVMSLGELSSDELKAVDAALRSPHTNEEILSQSWSGKQRDALEKTFDWSRQFNDLQANAGEAFWAETAFGKELYFSKSRANKVTRQLNKLVKAKQELSEGSTHFRNVFAKEEAVAGQMYPRIQTVSLIAQQVKTYATNPSLLSQVIGIPAEQLTTEMATALNDIYKDGGWAQQLNTAWQKQDWTAAEVSARELNKAIEKIPDIKSNSLGIKNLRRTVKEIDAMLKRLHSHRETLAQIKFAKMTGGKTVIDELEDKVKHENVEYLRISRENEPDMWDSVLLNVFEQNLSKYVHAAQELDARLAKSVSKPGIEQYSIAAELKAHPEYQLSLAHAKAISHWFAKNGIDQKHVNDLLADPYLLRDTIKLYTKNSIGNGRMPDFPKESVEAAMSEALDTVEALRAEGAEPRLVPAPTSVHAGTRLGILGGGVSLERIPGKHAARDPFDYESSIHDLQGGILGRTQNHFMRRATIDSIDAYLRPHLLPGRKVAELFMKTHPEEFFSGRLSPESATQEGARIIDQVIKDKWNLVTFDPEESVPVRLPNLGTGKYYVDADLLKAWNDSISRLQKKMLDAPLRYLDTGTNIFRMSILGYSPKYSFGHILFGGSMMLVLRSNPLDFRYLRDAWKMTKNGGQLDPEHLSKIGLPTDAQRVRYEAFPRHALSESTEDANFHFAQAMHDHAKGYSLAQLTAQEQVAKLFGVTPKDPNYLTSLLKVIPDLNFRFVRRTTNMQRAIALLSGASRATKRGYFYEDILDDAGNITRSQTPMTAEQALNEGVLAANKVMGDLRQATPLERNVFMRLMPFWGWTRHIIHYVMTYPIDHPFRTTILTQLADQDSADVSTGLPLRIQLLFFLGSPDKYGNVNAFDLRQMNPFRDTANYATLSGWFSALNPVLTAPVAAIDPSISFGDNVLYPNITYNNLYGTDVAQPAGNALTSLEQLVPETQALDEAFDISGQYAYLRNESSNQFYKKIMTALNVPFLQEQSLNLRQISAASEAKRFNQAKYAALDAWQSGDFSALLQYPGTVPDPRNDNYQITPAALQQLYTEYQRAAPGQPPSGVATPLPNPPL